MKPSLTQQFCQNSISLLFKIRLNFVNPVVTIQTAANRAHDLRVGTKLSNGSVKSFDD